MSLKKKEKINGDGLVPLKCLINPNIETLLIEKENVNHTNIIKDEAFFEFITKAITA